MSCSSLRASLHRPRRRRPAAPVAPCRPTRRGRAAAGCRRTARTPRRARRRRRPPRPGPRGRAAAARTSARCPAATPAPSSTRYSGASRSVRITSRPPSGPGWWSTKYSRPGTRPATGTGALPSAEVGTSAHLRGVPAARDEPDQLAAAGRLHLQLEAPVILVPDHRVVGLRGAEDVPEHPVGPVRVVEGRVQEAASRRPTSRGRSRCRSARREGRRRSSGRGRAAGRPRCPRGRPSTRAGVPSGLGSQTPSSRKSWPSATTFSSSSTSSGPSEPAGRRTCTAYWAPAGRRVRYSQPPASHGAERSSSGSAAASSAATVCRSVAQVRGPVVAPGVLGHEIGQQVRVVGAPHPGVVVDDRLAVQDPGPRPAGGDRRLGGRRARAAR